ncbi:MULTISPECIES: acyltransferase family protein [unclassified Mesorhizobium]|uniref:acyltransferase family protein n=1 Tax=unclassified Mesorhizobium TaxID=325217 RepID=UPI001126B76A|nr:MULTISPECIES: acyltransferase [unclassified Mesorhizobium]MBZ9808825.1 acyltransferase [Mesorhizobium sp. ESP-6-2]TPM32394.1 acyltransferase [Mesorhizobium sp. B2-2-2]
MRIDSLTSLRFFAAAAVLIHHMEFLQKSPSPDVQMVYGWFFEGFAGVQFFYILSGFVIAYSFASRGESLSFGDFLFFRAARIYPIHWLTLLAATYFYGALNSPSFDVWLRFFTNAALLQSFVPDVLFYFGFNGVSWSISTEMFFYAAFCLFVPLSSRAIIFSWSALMLVIVINILAVHLDNGFSSWLLYINPVFRFIDFLTGVLLYRLFVARPLQMSHRAATVAEFVSIALVALSVIVAMEWAVPLQWRWDVYYVPSMALMIFVFAHQRGFVSSMLNNRLLVLLGDSSFALYMVHQIVITLSPWVMHPETILRLEDMAKVTVILLLVAIALSVALHVWFEKPVNTWLRRWWTKRKVVSGVDPAVT